MSARLKGNVPELPLKAYAGTYVNTLYGPIEITANKKDLLIRFEGHKNLTASLKYLDNGEWMMTYSNAAYGIFPLKFKIENGKVISTETKVNDGLEYDPYLFVKQN